MHSHLRKHRRSEDHPRDEVPRAIRSFRSDPPRFRYIPTSAPMRIDGTVTLSQLLRGLRSAGLTYMRDERTGEYAVMPDPEAQG
jgi:hypothetical protein